MSEKMRLTASELCEVSGLSLEQWGIDETTSVVVSEKFVNGYTADGIDIPDLCAGNNALQRKVWAEVSSRWGSTEMNDIKITADIETEAAVYATTPKPVAVEFALENETIRDLGGILDHAGIDHCSIKDACLAYRQAAIETLRDDRRARRLDDCSPKGQRRLHSQWCGAHWGYCSGAIGTMACDLTDDEKAAISEADDAGREAARKVIAEADAAAASE
jgi:hypothetical protein